MIAGRHRGPRSIGVGLVLAAVLAAAACATHTDRLLPVMESVTAGDYAAAVDGLNGFIGVDSAEELPGKWGADGALAVLDRGVLLQALQRFADSSHDLSAAEERLELIDLTKDPVGTLAGYLYSDSRKPYRATPTERLALNGVNLLNYLARGDLEGAAVEARRYQAARDFLENESVADRAVSAFGAYLAGFVFEHLGEGDRALRYYEDALALGPLSSLVTPAARLAAMNPFRGPRLGSLLSGKAPRQSSGNGGEILVVLSLGRVPYKVPERMPVGVAVGIAGSAVSGNSDWLVRGATKFIVYPELVSAPAAVGGAHVRLDDGDVEVEPLVDVAAAVREEYDEMRPKIIAAALSRLASRAAVAEGVRAAGDQKNNVLGDALAFLIEGALVGLDRPDTRSWTMLPGRILVARVPVAPGEHHVDVTLEGVAQARTSSVTVAPNGYGIVVVTEPR